jgi:protein TonB
VNAATGAAATDAAHTLRTGSNDRLGVTFLFSLIAHAVIALGITFEYVKSAPQMPSLDVILVQSANAEKPDKADFLAQVANSGGGNSDRALRPSDPLSGPLPKALAGIAPRPTETGAPKPTPPSRTEVLTSAHADVRVPNDEAAPQAPDEQLPVERETLERELEMARLAAEMRDLSQQYAKRPKRKYISANTREYAYAQYMQNWVNRVERVGNLNYPDEARRRQLHGQLVLTVGLDRNGAVKSIDIIDPSGFKVLDDAAIRIVRLAAPFEPIPQEPEKLDELYVTRTWQFLPGDILRNR